MFKKVKYLIPAYDIDMGGIPVKQALPTQNVNLVDPFLLLHHAIFNYSDDAPAIQQGLDPHPHRGFSPVTFVIEGEVHHRDSRGNNQIAKKGEVQWMHAGAGIIHSERPSQDLAKRNGRQEIVQLWINSPADKKMLEPNYQFIAEKDIPVFKSEDNLVTNKLIAGNYDGFMSKTETQSEILIIWSTLKPGGSQTFDLPGLYNVMLYVISGSVILTTYGIVGKECLVVFDNKSEVIEISSKSDARILLLAGKPIGEKVVRQGPFVMNNTTEIMEAMRDYQMGKMGILIEEK